MAFVFLSNLLSFLASCAKISNSNDLLSFSAAHTIYFLLFSLKNIFVLLVSHRSTLVWLHNVRVLFYLSSFLLLLFYLFTSLLAFYCCCFDLNRVVVVGSLHIYTYMYKYICMCLVITSLSSQFRFTTFSAVSTSTLSFTRSSLSLPLYLTLVTESFFSSAFLFTFISFR